MACQEESVTRTTESGAFIRTIIRKGKNRKQDTKRMKKNDKKVILGHIGEFEVYVYPYDYPDTVFIGKFPVSTQIEAGAWKELARVMMRIKAYSENQYFFKDGRRKEANARRCTIKKAYNLGLKDAGKPK